MVYAVIILRKDQQHISVMEDTNYSKCLEKWEALHLQWVEAYKSTSPFILKDPIVTAFEPGLISEIKLVPLMDESVVDTDNPYQKKMLQRGLSEMQGNDLLARISGNQF